MKICNKVVATLTKRLLNTYLESGTLKFDKSLGNAVKFSRVGRVTKNRGENIRISSKDYNEEQIVYIIGKTENSPKRIKKKK